MPEMQKPVVEPEVVQTFSAWVQTDNHTVIAMPDDKGDLHLFVHANGWKINGKLISESPEIMQAYNKLLAKIAKHNQKG